MRGSTLAPMYLFRRSVRFALALALMITAAAPAISAQGAQVWPITHHDIEASVDPVAGRIEVTDRITLAAPRERNEPLYLLLRRGLDVSFAGVGNEPLVASTSERFQPRHFWDRPDYERMDDYAAARELTIHPPAGGWPAAPEITLRYAGAIYDSLQAPRIAYGRGFETTAGLIDPRGAYLYGATFWIPWSGDALFRFRLRANVPKGWESVSQGSWAERRVLEEGRVQSLWVVDDPMNEAYLIAGPYTVREAESRETGTGRVRALTFTYDNTPADLCQTYLDATGEYLRHYEALIGSYPFDKFAMVENWWQTGFGMPSFTFLGDRVIRLPFIVHTSFGHEILHNWWGNGVFVDYEKGNWCEGLTTYLADYSYKEKESPKAARDYRLRQLQAYLDYASAGEKDFALRKFTERASPSTQAVGYGKTMMVFHMARRLLGDETFFAGLRRFYEEHLFEEASWDDVVESFEKASAQTLAPWFEQWIGRPGAPVLTVTRARDTGRVVLRQEEPFYDLCVPVQVEIDGTVESMGVVIKGATAEVTLKPGATWLAVDPDFEMFRKLHRGEIPPAMSQVLGADSAMVVIGSRSSADLADALRKLAADWRGERGLRVVEEADFVPVAGRSVWLFGDGEWVDAIFEESFSFGEAPRTLRSDALANDRTLVASFRDRDNPEVAWTAVLPADASVVEALGRKLPHYGSYSYLVFEGETNVDKGTWAVESSPLRLDLTEE